MIGFIKPASIILETCTYIASFRCDMKFARVFVLPPVWRAAALRQSGDEVPDSWTGPVPFSAAPRLVRTPARDVFVNIGDSLTLTCQARGTPQPVISWLKVSDLAADI